MTATYSAIATTTLGSAASSITFSSIPGTYTDLRIVLVGTFAVANNNLLLRINNDSGNNYSQTNLTGNGSAASSSRQTNISYVDAAATGNSTTIPVLSEIDIFSYTASVNKSILWSGNVDTNGAGFTRRGVSLWRNTAAITSITLLPFDNNFNSGTTATLYGITKE